MICCIHCSGYLQLHHSKKKKKKKTEERSHHSIEIKTSVILRGYAVFRLRLFLIFLGVLGRMWNSFNATSTSTAKYVDVTV